MKILQNVLILSILSIMIMGCHENFHGPLYQYTITCPNQSEPKVFTESREISVTYSTYASGYIKLAVNHRHDASTIEEYEWPDPLGCFLHKKFLRNVEPESNDG